MYINTCTTSPIWSSPILPSSVSLVDLPIILQTLFLLFLRLVRVPSLLSCLFYFGVYNFSSLGVFIQTLNNRSYGFSRPYLILMGFTHSCLNSVCRPISRLVKEKNDPYARPLHKGSEGSQLAPINYSRSVTTHLSLLSTMKIRIGYFRRECNGK